MGKGRIWVYDMWWITQTGDYFASGFGGHYLGISFKRRLVIVNRVNTVAEGAERITWYLFDKKVSMDVFSKLLNFICSSVEINSSALVACLGYQTLLV